MGTARGRGANRTTQRDTRNDTNDDVFRAMKRRRVHRRRRHRCASGLLRGLQRHEQHRRLVSLGVPTRTNWGHDGRGYQYRHCGQVVNAHVNGRTNVRRPTDHRRRARHRRHARTNRGTRQGAGRLARVDVILLHRGAYSGGQCYRQGTNHEGHGRRGMCKVNRLMRASALTARRA